MTYQRHGIYIRNLAILPKQLRKEITETEKQLQKIDESTKQGRRKYMEKFRKLEKLKTRADTIQPNWRKQRQCQKNTAPKT
jgi:phage shock protein A